MRPVATTTSDARGFVFRVSDVSDWSRLFNSVANQTHHFHNLKFQTVSALYSRTNWPLFKPCFDFKVTAVVGENMAWLAVLNYNNLLSAIQQTIQGSGGEKIENPWY
jgi:hypothetical protein